MSEAIRSSAQDSPRRRPNEATSCACGFSAEEVAEALITKVKDPETAAAIIDVWGGHIDKQLGRGLRRFALYILIGLLSMAAVKLGFLEKLIK